MEQSFKRVAVVGCGLMGASWASLFLAHGIDVQAHDPASNSEDRLRHFVGHALAQLRELGRTGQGQLRFTPDLSQALENVDQATFDAVHAVLARAVDERNLDATLLPELLDSDLDWRLQTHLRLSTHRPAVGRFILLVKRRLLLPLTRWLFEYSQENFRRQDRLNRVLFACIEELAIENARLRQALGARSDTP